MPAQAHGAEPGRAATASFTAPDWIESEAARLIAFQKDDGTIERWYGDPEPDPP